MLRRLTYLAFGELIAGGALLVAVFGIADAPASPGNVAGAAAAMILLLQGSAYWAAKSRQLRTGEPELPGVGVFRVLCVLDPILLIVLGGVVARDAAADPPATVAGIAFWILAVLEYVNYFFRQLMYDNAADMRWLTTNGIKRSSLSRDLAAAARRARRVG